MIFAWCRFFYSILLENLLFYNYSEKNMEYMVEQAKFCLLRRREEIRKECEIVDR